MLPSPAKAAHPRLLPKPDRRMRYDLLGSCADRCTEALMIVFIVRMPVKRVRAGLRPRQPIRNLCL